MPGEDFVHVRLTAAAAEWLAENSAGTLRINTHGCDDLVFTPGKSERVTRAVDWTKRLEHQQLPNGVQAFETAEEES